MKTIDNIYNIIYITCYWAGLLWTLPSFGKKTKSRMPVGCSQESPKSTMIWRKWWRFVRTCLLPRWAQSMLCWQQSLVAKTMRNSWTFWPSLSPFAKRWRTDTISCSMHKSYASANHYHTRHHGWYLIICCLIWNGYHDCTHNSRIFHVVNVRRLDVSCASFPLT